MTVERGQVQAKEFTKNGKPKLKIGGNWYFAGRCDVSNLNPGQMIEFEWAEFGEPNERTGRKPRGLNNWGLINGVAASNDADRPFISNIVAHAIQAGLIKEPEQLDKWALAAQGAMRALKGERPAPRAPASSAPPRGHDTPPRDGFDSDMPEGFYADTPPPEEPPRGTRTW